MYTENILNTGITNLSCRYVWNLFIPKVCTMILIYSLFFFRFKMKVGVSIEDDRRRAKIIRQEIGMDKPLVIFNFCWLVRVS